MSDTTNPGPPERAKRTSPGQFLKETRIELRRVAWPNRQEVTQYSLIVLAVTLVLGGLIFGVDQLFGQLVFWMFG